MAIVKEILELIGFYKYIQPMVAAFIIAMGIVYALGRMTGILEQPRYKNTAALIGIVCWAFLEFFGFIPQPVNDFLMVACGGIILYVLVGFRLYDRFNKIADRKVKGEK